MNDHDEVWKRETALIQELEGQSDRGVAIVGMAWVEEELEGAIQGFLKKESKAWRRLFGRSGPLATLSAKIDLACLLGIASNTITSDLHILREIRNEFAHSITAADDTALQFTSNHLKDKCLALKCISHERLAEPRAAFVRACVTLNSDFYFQRILCRDVSPDHQVTANIERGA